MKDGLGDVVVGVLVISVSVSVDGVLEVVGPETLDLVTGVKTVSAAEGPAAAAVGSQILLQVLSVSLLSSPLLLSSTVLLSTPARLTVLYSSAHATVSYASLTSHWTIGVST